jgi:hypothetical protein
VAARKKRKSQSCEWEFGEPCKATTPVDVAGTWVRESGGGIQHLVVKKITDEIMPEEWNQAGAEADWDTTLESLRRNLGARSIRLVEEDGMMKIL